MEGVGLKDEFHAAIENWRKVWKNGTMDEVLNLYSENVRVMRSGLGLIVGRDEQKKALELFKNRYASFDIDYVRDEIGGFSTDGDTSYAYERYHEAVVRKDGSEISMIYGVMFWKKVAGSWLIDMYANCHVTANATNIGKLQTLIQQEFMKMGSAWSSQDVGEVAKFFSDDCLFMPPGRVIRGRESVQKWLEEVFAKGWQLWTAAVESVIPVDEAYITYRLVYVSYPSFAIQDSSGKVVVQGSGNAMVKGKDNDWEICEAVWNFSSGQK